MTEQHPNQQLADQLATNLRQLADMVENSPQLAETLRYSFSMINAFSDDPAHLAEFMRAGRRHGAETTKTANKGSEWFVAQLKWGRVGLEVNARREQVCERVVVDTREITEEVPDPEALAAVPTVTVTRTEEVVEWQCRPLLAAEAVTA